MEVGGGRRRTKGGEDREGEEERGEGGIRKKSEKERENVEIMGWEGRRE